MGCQRMEMLGLASAVPTRNSSCPEPVETQNARWKSCASFRIQRGRRIRRMLVHNEPWKAVSKVSIPTGEDFPAGYPSPAVSAGARFVMALGCRGAPWAWPAPQHSGSGRFCQPGEQDSALCPLSPCHLCPGAGHPLLPTQGPGHFCLS